MISVLTPTRGRPSQAALMSLSFLGTAKGDVELLFYVDEDDPQLGEYKRAHTHMQGIEPLNLHIGPAWGVGRAWNHLWHKSSGDLIMMGNDDLRMETDGWDEIVHECFDAFVDRFVCMWGNDGINGENHCAFPIVSKEWCQVLNYFTPEVFEFFRHDTWIFDIAKKLDRTWYAPALKFMHHHFTTPLSQPDGTTRRNRDRNQGAIDALVWKNTEDERVRHAAMLRNAIDLRSALKIWTEGSSK